MPLTETTYTANDADGVEQTYKGYIDTVGSPPVQVIIPAKVIDDLIPGTEATSLGKAEDAAHASGDTGVAVWAVRRDTRAVGSGADGDYSSVNVDGYGNVYVQTSQNRVLVEAVPTTAAGAYAAGDVVGTLMTISNAVRAAGLSGVIENIVINDKANVISNLDLVIFKEIPSSSTFTDNAAYTVDVADWDKIAAAVNVDNVYAAAGNRTNQYCPPAGIPFIGVATSIYAVLVCRTAFTLASATDLKLALTIRRD